MNIEKVALGLDTKQYEQPQYYSGSSSMGFRTAFDNAMKLTKGAVELHFEDEPDGKALGATADMNCSITVYRPIDFDMLSPSYKVKIWDNEGNVTERIIDLSSVDPKNADFTQMYAYSCYLTDSGIDEDAQNTFMIMTADYRSNGIDTDTKKDWLDYAKDIMKSHYQAGNLKEYMDIRLFAENIADMFSF